MKNYNLRIRFLEVTFFSVLFVLIFSCKKEPDCFECTTTFDITYRYENTFEKFTTSDTQNFCDMSEAEATDYEVSNTDTYTEENNGFTTTTIKTTKCTR